MHAGSSASKGMTNALDLRSKAHIKRAAFTTDNGTKSRPMTENSQSFAGFTNMATYDSTRNAAAINIIRRDVSPKNLFFDILLSCCFTGAQSPGALVVPAVQSMSLLPEHHKQKTEDESSEVGKMGNSAACTGNSCQKFYCSEYEDKPLCFH